MRLLPPIPPNSSPNSVRIAGGWVVCVGGTRSSSTTQRNDNFPLDYRRHPDEGWRSRHVGIYDRDTQPPGNPVSVPACPA